MDVTRCAACLSLSDSLSWGWGEVGGGAVTLQQSALAHSGDASADHCSLCQGPNRVLYSLSHCVQTAALQVIQGSYRDALVQQQEQRCAQTQDVAAVCVSASLQA